MKKSKLPKSLTTVTPLSKTLALILFIALPFIGFYFGTKYNSVTPSKPLNLESTVSSSKNYHDDLFSVQIPRDWTVVEEMNESKQRRIHFRNEEGKNYIGVSELNSEDVKAHIEDITTNTQQDFKKSEVFVGGEKATEYFGCVGVEGCADVYNIFVTHKGMNYQIDFSANVDVPTSVFNNFVSSLTFTN